MGYTLRQHVVEEHQPNGRDHPLCHPGQTDRLTLTELCEEVKGVPRLSVFLKDDSLQISARCDAEKEIIFKRVAHAPLAALRNHIHVLRIGK